MQTCFLAGSNGFSTPFIRKKKKISPIFEHLYDGLTSPLNREEKPEEKVSAQVLDMANAMRGTKRQPAIFLHGVMPRSGTVYFGEVLRLYPEVFAYPNKLWELPFMTHAGDLINYQEKFFQTYQQNRSQMEQNDLLCLFGAAMMNYLHSFVPEGKILLIKVPWMQFLNYFFTFFPKKRLLLLMRDGRDVVHSTIRTWPNRDFEDVCRQWDSSARIFLDLQEKFNSDEYRICFVKFEDLLQEPEDVTRGVLQTFDLDCQKFPADKIHNLPVRGSSAMQQEGKVSWSPVQKQTKYKPGGKWRSWSRQEKKLFKNICGETLIKLDYAENSEW